MNYIQYKNNKPAFGFNKENIGKKFVAETIRDEKNKLSKFILKEEKNDEFLIKKKIVAGDPRTTCQCRPTDQGIICEAPKPKPTSVVFCHHNVRQSIQRIAYNIKTFLIKNL